MLWRSLFSVISCLCTLQIPDRNAISVHQLHSCQLNVQDFLHPLPSRMSFQLLGGLQDFGPIHLSFKILLGNSTPYFSQWVYLPLTIFIIFIFNNILKSSFHTVPKYPCKKCQSTIYSHQCVPQYNLLKKRKMENEEVGKKRRESIKNQASRRRKTCLPTVHKERGKWTNEVRFVHGAPCHWQFWQSFLQSIVFHVNMASGASGLNHMLHKVMKGKDPNLDAIDSGYSGFSK